MIAQFLAGAFIGGITCTLPKKTRLIAVMLLLGLFVALLLAAWADRGQQGATAMVRLTISGVIAHRVVLTGIAVAKIFAWMLGR